MYIKEKSGTFHFYPKDWWKILEELNIGDFKLDERIPLNPTMYEELITEITSFDLYDYQSEAIDKWIAQDRCGIILLPTGAGKTHVALAAMLESGVRTLIHVPTLVLIDQWKEALRDTLAVDEVKVFAGGSKEIGRITLTTYDSASIYIHRFRNKFGLLIFDEVHHLTGETFQNAARGSFAPYRLGLSATIDGGCEKTLKELIGSVVIRLTPEEIREKGKLADFKLQKVSVELPKLVREAYEANVSLYRQYLKKLRTANPFQVMIYRTTTDPEAKKALNAYRKAKEIAFSPSQKLSAVESILTNHPTESILIFSESIPFCEEITREFSIPNISHKTPSNERKTILANFRKGHYRILVTGRILDEGYDVPIASIGIIVSGSASQRQFIQRLGRLLRPQPKKHAILYELVTKNTTELRTARLRKAYQRKGN